MASALSKQEIRRNPLIDMLVWVVRFVQTNRTAVLAGAVGLCVVAAAAGGYWWYRAAEEERASKALVSAFMAGRTEQPGTQPNPDEVMKRLREVAQQHRGTKGGEEALIALANAQVETGKLDDALASYTEYLAGYRRGRFTVMASLGKAYAQEAKGDLQGAAQTLSEVLDQEKDNPLIGEALVTLGRVYEGLKKRDEAMRTYGRVVDRFGQTSWAQTALRRMEALKAK